MTTKRKIFILDDDEHFLADTKLLLEEAGYEVFTCSKSTQALRALRDFKPDCLILDIRMPLFDATAAITEWGLFSQAATGGGVLWSRIVFAALNVASGDSIQFTYDLTVE